MRTPRPLPQTPGDIEAYLADLAREGKSPVTIHGYKSDLADFVRYYEETYGETFDTKACLGRDIAEYKTHLRVTRRLGAATVNRHLSTLRSFFRWAEAEGLVQDVPTARVSRVRATRSAPQALERREVNRLLRAAEKAAQRRDIAIITLLLGTGLRVAELCNLRLKDVSLGKVRGHLKVVSGKGDKDRTLPLNADVVAALRSWYAVRPKTADNHLFLGRTGKALTHDGLQYLVRKYGQLAGIEHLHPHVLRHCFARRLLERGVDIASVSRLLGHEDLRTTMRYVEPSTQDLEDAVAKLEEDW